ncbi:MAG TPA: carboxypeptidase-like regulatory domain-containing protein [Bryobacteraceae bacterium]|nr:carboxypeptidase-like regulatory domain-containing protein [Bryobacteraceae bacterium]
MSPSKRLVIFLACAGVHLLKAQTEQRIPRQRAPAAAVIGLAQNPVGLGLGGASIELRQPGGPILRATTKGDGSFRFAGLSPGHYEFSATLDGFEPFSTSFAVTAGELVSVDAVLRPIAKMGPPTPAPAPGVPYRNVPDASTAAPVEAAPVETLPPADKVFTPMPNRWNYDFPDYHRYPPPAEIPYVTGHFFDPFNQNQLKGDKPIIGQHTFLDLNFTSDTFTEGRIVPAANSVSAAQPQSYGFFGGFGQFALNQDFALSATLFSGDTSFKPIDWQVRFTPVFNINYLNVEDTGIVNINPAAGTTRLDSHIGLQEAFVEKKLADLSDSYDFISLRAGIQSFNSDFRGFIFADQEPGVRLFGNLDSNRYQYNLAYFAMLNKDTNSGLNTFAYRNQQVMVANVYRQDFFKPGYTVQASFHYDKDDPSVAYDTNGFLVRPAPIGNVQRHAIRAYYYGLTGDGHIGRLNIDHAFYQVLGHDTFNPIAGRPTSINAQMAAAELSYDRDWIRFRTAAFFASGDKNPRDGTARGFDSIFDDSQFAGGFFSFWDREGIRLTGTGVGLVQEGSLVPDLRSSKIEGQANFVNPGLMLWNASTDFDITPKLRAIVNLNLIRFVDTEPLELLLFQSNIHAGVGADSGIGVSYRPPLSENITINGVLNAFLPFQGFKDIYTGQTLFGAAINVRFRF